MIISDTAHGPGAIFKGKEYPHPDGRKVAGMIFYNDEGTENGGLIWGGNKGKDGKVSSHGHLSFDNYEQDQVMVIEGNQDEEGKSSFRSTGRTLCFRPTITKSAVAPPGRFANLIDT